MAFGLAIVLLPVLLVHTVLLGIGAILDRLLRRGPGSGTTVILDAVCSIEAFFLVELVVGGGLLGLIATRWFGSPDIGATEVVIGLFLWAPAAVFLLVETVSFFATAVQKVSSGQDCRNS